MIARAKSLRILTGVVVVGVMTFSVVMYLQNRALKRFIAAGGETLSPDVCRLLLADLESADPQRLKAWSAYFRHRSQLQSTAVRGNALEQTLFLYQTKEYPGRSNYFNDLLLAVNTTYQTVGINKIALMRLLGEPDNMANSGEDQLLQYDYNLYGIPWVAFVWITNDSVKEMRFNAKR